MLLCRTCHIDNCNVIRKSIAHDEQPKDDVTNADTSVENSVKVAASGRVANFRCYNDTSNNPVVCKDKSSCYK